MIINAKKYENILLNFKHSYHHFEIKLLINPVHILIASYYIVHLINYIFCKYYLCFLIFDMNNKNTLSVNICK
nr:MAG TPA: hypothetical protein [Caudoviricetes sp.]